MVRIVFMKINLVVVCSIVLRDWVLLGYFCNLGQNDEALDLKGSPGKRKGGEGKIGSNRS